MWPIILSVTTYLFTGIAYSLGYALIFEPTRQRFERELPFIILAWPIYVVLHVFLQGIRFASRIIFDLKTKVFRFDSSSENRDQ